MSSVIQCKQYIARGSWLLCATNAHSITNEAGVFFFRLTEEIQHRHKTTFTDSCFHCSHLKYNTDIPRLLSPTCFYCSHMKYNIDIPRPLSPTCLHCSHMKHKTDIPRLLSPIFFPRLTLRGLYTTHIFPAYSRGTVPQPYVHLVPRHIHIIHSTTTLRPPSSSPHTHNTQYHNPTST